MNELLPFSKCLQHLIKKHGLISAQFAQLIGGRGEWKKLLSDSLSSSKLELYFERIKEAQLFSPEEYHCLEQAMKISQTGAEKYFFEHSIDQIFMGIQPDVSRPLLLENQLPMEKRLRSLLDADELDIICLNCCFPSSIQSLIPLFSQRSARIHMRHYLHSDALSTRPAGLISSIMPFIFDHRYELYSISPPEDKMLRSMGGNILCIKKSKADILSQLFFVLMDDEHAVELDNSGGTDLFGFLEHLLTKISPVLQPLKEPDLSTDDFSSLCMTFLSHELNRATYSLSNALSFQQVPSDIAVAALKDKAIFSSADNNALLERTLIIHEQRHQNIYRKKKNTYQIMTTTGCEHFLRTGYCMNHFIGFRAFTPEERKKIFGKMIEGAENSTFYIPLLMKEANFHYRYNLVCYEKLGISIDHRDTDYDISKGYRSTFLMFSKFTQQYQDYYLNTIVKEKCYSKEESLSLLKSIYHRFIAEFSLVP